ncbi:unnamed protein product [Ophioblennius macclurei]
MDVPPLHPPLAMDLSKTYNTRNRSRSAAVDLAKKPEWYHHRTADLSSPSPASAYRTRASSSYAALASAPPTASVRRREGEPSPEPLGAYVNSALAPRLDLYRDGVHGVHGNLWHSGFYRAEPGGGPLAESSGGEESDSGSDVIFLVSSAKEPLLCGSFVQDGMRHMVEPLSPAMSSLDEGQNLYRVPQPLSSPSPDSSFSEASTDSSLDIPVHHARPVVLVSDLAAMYGAPALAVAPTSEDDDSDVVEVAVGQADEGRSCRKAEHREVRRSNRIRKSSSDTPPLGCGGTRRRLRRRAKNDAVGIYNESGDSDDLMEFVVRASSSDESLPRAGGISQGGISQGGISQGGISQDGAAERPLTRSKAKVVQSASDGVTDSKRPRRTELKPAQQKTTEKTSKKKPAATRCRTKRRRQTSASSPFAPPEPDILLRFAKRKEEPKKRAELFYPFVRMERRTCVVVNYQEDHAATHPLLAVVAGAPTGFVPNTSCFQLGRPASNDRSPASPLCCLCGSTANAMGLGDLHGPYRLQRTCAGGERGEESPRRPAHGRSATMEDDSGGEREEEPRRQLVNWWGEHGAKRPAHGEASPPPLRTSQPLDEWWIHEDCGIWSTGVFLVRGRLYGLEEAARVAQEAMCSSCQQTGAILGCFQKSCSRTFHYRCAVQSGCVLNEENFSMRCPQHKNKPSTKQQPR